jgi:hypothetical protein
VQAAPAALPEPTDAVNATPAALPEPTDAVNATPAALPEPTDAVNATPAALPESDGVAAPVESAPATPPIERAVASFVGRRETAPIARGLGLPFLLVALGFCAGRLTAPRPSIAVAPLGQSAPLAAEPPPATLPATPPPATPPTTPVVLAPIAPAEPPPVAAAATPSTAPPPPAATTVERDSPPPRRSVTAGARPVATAHGAEAASKTGTAPAATAHPVNSFVQAVRDDIAEDEADHKKP